jgi:hypothetical protein
MASWPSRATAAPAIAAATAAPASSRVQARPWLLPQAARLFAAHARLYCISALIPGLLGIISLTAISIFMLRGAGEGALDTRALWEAMSFWRKFIAILGVTLALWTPILLAARAVCRITVGQLSGKPVGLPMTMADMAKFLPAALVYSFVIGFPIMIGAAMLLLPGIVVATLFVLIVPTSVNEPGSLPETYSRGISLAWKVFAKGLTVTAFCAALVLLIRIMVDRFLPDTRILFALRFTLIYIPALLLLILANIYYSLLYLEAREKLKHSPAA